MDSSHDYHPEDHIADRPAMPTHAELEALLDADEADVATGQVVLLELVLQGCEQWLSGSAASAT